MRPGESIRRQLASLRSLVTAWLGARWVGLELGGWPGRVAELEDIAPTRVSASGVGRY